MAERFEYVIRASGGWAQARLTLADDRALIEYDSSSMGGKPLRYLLHCDHKKYSDFHGELMLTALEQFVSQPNASGQYVMTDVKEAVTLGKLIDPTADDDLLEGLSRLDMEYIRLPQAQINLEEPGGGWGIHEQTETFNLILMIYFAGFWADESSSFEKTRLGQGLLHLDKMHFAPAEGKFRD